MLVLVKNEKGSSSLEYVLLAALICLGSILGYSMLGVDLERKFHFYSYVVAVSGSDFNVGGKGPDNSGGSGR